MFKAFKIMTHGANIVVVLFLVTFLQSSPVFAGLYDRNDAVTILGVSNFKNIVCNSENAWVVQFYNSWCGHCIRFAPTWKTFAHDVSEWRKVVRIGVVDCAEKENTALCREYNIQSYPSIKLFGPLASETDAGEQYSDTRDVTTLRHGIIAMLEGVTKDKIPDNWPTLQLLPSLDELKTNPASVVAVVVEDESSFVGREIILDLSSRSDVRVGHILPAVAQLTGTQQYPALYTLDKSSHLFVLRQSDIRNRTSASKLLQDLVGYTPVKQNVGLEIHEKTTLRPATRPLTKIYMKDLESGLLYSLTREVAAMKYIISDKLDALKKYTTVLAKYFPGDHRMMQSLSEINEWTSKKTALNGKQFGDMIKQVQERNPSFPSTVEWRGCKGSSEKYRGYPCSLWTLFHTLTVTSVADQGSDFESTEVLLAMREYIRKFFGCRECSEHFTQAAAKLEQEVTTPDSSIMWLWRSHNRANWFLKGDATEDPQHPKIQFPSSRDCPLCHAEAGYNDTQVLVFLKSLYGRKNIVLEEGDEISRLKSKVYMQDLESTLLYSFTQELAIQKEVDGQSYANLKKFVQVLYKYFPGDDEMKSFLEEVVAWMNVRSSFSGEEWATMITETQAKHQTVLNDVKWHSCQGSWPKFRGYPCGLWVLFHTLTVNAYTSHQQEGTLGSYNPLEVLDSVRGYIHSFFGCRECSKNFAKMAKKLEVEVQEADDSVTWLWHAHNRANKRLHGDKTEDPDHIKIQFPSKEECPKCHDESQVDFPWSVRQVMQYLLRLYKKENIIGWRPTKVQLERRKVNAMDQEGEVVISQDKQKPFRDNKVQDVIANDAKFDNGPRGGAVVDDDAQGGAQGSYDVAKGKSFPDKSRLDRIRSMRDMEKMTRKRVSVVARSGMNSTDIGLCVIFYVMCMAIILFLYFHFMVRKKHKLPCKMCPV